MFNIGVWVYIKLQPHIQQLVQRRTKHKLSFKYFGSYLVLQRIGKVAYKIQLPARSKIHLVLHVSQLKKAMVTSSSAWQSMVLPSTYQLLVACLHKIGHSVVPFMLVQLNGGLEAGQLRSGSTA